MYRWTLKNTSLVETWATVCPMQAKPATVAGWSGPSPSHLPPTVLLLAHCSLQALPPLHCCHYLLLPPPPCVHCSSTSHVDSLSPRAPFPSLCLPLSLRQLPIMSASWVTLYHYDIFADEQVHADGALHGLPAVDAAAALDDLLVPTAPTSHSTPSSTTNAVGAGVATSTRILKLCVVG